MFDDVMIVFGVTFEISFLIVFSKGFDSGHADSGVNYAKKVL
jgi:hypothetical protein